MEMKPYLKGIEQFDGALDHLSVCGGSHAPGTLQLRSDSDIVVHSCLLYRWSSLQARTLPFPMWTLWTRLDSSMAVLATPLMSMRKRGGGGVGLG